MGVDDFKREARGRGREPDESYCLVRTGGHRLNA